MAIHNQSINSLKKANKMKHVSMREITIFVTATNRNKIVPAYKCYRVLHFVLGKKWFGRYF